MKKTAQRIARRSHTQRANNDGQLMRASMAQPGGACKRKDWQRVGGLVCAILWGLVLAWFFVRAI
jgi:hypothetical protein